MNASSIFNIRRKKPLCILMSYLPKSRKLEIVQRNKHLQKLLKIKEVLYEIYSLKNSNIDTPLKYTLDKNSDDEYTKRETLNSLFDISNLPFLNGIGFTLEGHKDKITSIVKLPPIEDDEYKLASFGWDDTIKIWDIDKKELDFSFPTTNNGDMICTLIPHYYDEKNNLQSKSHLIFALTRDKYILIYDLKRAKIEKERKIQMEEEKKKIEKINFEASNSFHKKMKSLENEQANLNVRPPYMLETQRIEQVGKLLCAIKNGNYLITATYFKEIRVWRIPDFYDEADVYERTVRSDVDKKRFSLFCTLKGHIDVVPKLTNLQDGRVASCSWDKTIKIWDLKKAKFDVSIDTNCQLTDLIQLQNGKLAVLTTEDKVRIYSIDNKICECEFEGCDFIYQLSDGRIVTGKFDLMFQIVDIKDKKNKDDKYETSVALIYKTDHKDTISCFLQLDDGRIMTSSHDKTIKLYGFVTCKELNNEAYDYDFEFCNECLYITYNKPMDPKELYKHSRIFNPDYEDEETKKNKKNKKTSFY